MAASALGNYVLAGASVAVSALKGFLALAGAMLGAALAVLGAPTSEAYRPPPRIVKAKVRSPRRLVAPAGSSHRLVARRGGARRIVALVRAA